MVDIQLLQAISTAIASAGVFVAAIYYILQIRNQAKARTIDLAMRLDAVWESNEMLEAHAALMERDPKEYHAFGLDNPRKWIPESRVGGFFMTLGFLVRKKLVDIDLAYNLFPFMKTWEKLRLYVEKVRKETNKPWLDKDLEYLFNEMKNKEQQLQQEGVKNG